MIDNTHSNENTQSSARTLPGLTLGGVGDTTIGPREGGTRSRQQSQFAPGDMIGDRYQVLGVIGTGGFGCVYKVNQVLLKKEFALKTLNPVNLTEVTVIRLRKEAQAASRLQHPNLVQAVDFGMIDENQPFLVMDLVEGPTLAEYLKENGRLGLDKAIDIFIPLAQAVAYAHLQGVVHRDLKPSNVILSADKSHAAEFNPKIVDFGIAKIRFADETALSLTGTGDVFGTPLYMSPEQCAGTGVDARSDIYSLGCMLFEALTGAPPYNGRNPLEVMMQHGAAKLPTLKEGSLGENFAPELERIVSSMLAKLPDERYSNAQKVADDLFWLKHGDFDRISTIAQTGAVVTRIEERKQTALHTAYVGIACTIIGAVIAYGAAMLIAKPEGHADKTILTDIKIDSGLGADVDDAFLSGTANGGSDFVFKFPKVGGVGGRTAQPPVKSRINGIFMRDDDHEPGWGSFYWWNSNQNQKAGVPKKPASIVVPINGQPISMSKTANLILKAGFEIVQYPSTWGRFRPDDLYGIILSKNTCSFSDSTMNQVICSLLFQNNLHILTMNTLTISPRGLHSIGLLSTLRWLDMTRVWVKDNPNTFDPPTVTGAQVASFPFLPKLRVLRLDTVSHVTPVLEKLALGNDLRWLSLANDKCTDEDVVLIGQLHGLEILDIRGAAQLDSDKFLEALAGLKNLKKVIVDMDVLEHTDPEKLAVLQKRATVVPAATKPSERLGIGKGCAPTIVGEEGAKEDWLNSIYQDPGQVGL